MGLLEPWVLCALPSRRFSMLPHCSAASLHVAAPRFLPHGCFQLLLHISGPIPASLYARGAAGHLPGFGDMPGRRGLQSGLQMIAPSDGQGCLFPQVEAIFYAPGEISSLSVCAQVEDRRETNTLQVINLRAKQELMEGTSFTRVSQFVTPSPTAAAHLCFFALS